MASKNLSYLQRYLSRLMADAAPWARDNIGWAAAMLILPLIAVWIRDPKHDIDWTLVRTTLWLYAIAFGIYISIHAIRTVWKLDKELTTECEILKNRIERLESVPPEIKLTIEDVVMHRTGDEEWRWKNGEFLVQISAELVNLPAVDVCYSALLIFRGVETPLTPIRDLEGWEIVEREYYKNLSLILYPKSPYIGRPRSSFVTNPIAIAERLSRSIKKEGWLHFRIERMDEREIAKRTLRIYAKSNNGGSYADRQLAQDHVVRSELVALRRPIPTQQ